LFWIPDLVRYCFSICNEGGSIGGMYQLKVSLNNFRPPIWRRLLIGEEASFYDLHSLIQDAFGWFDCHMHNFWRRQGQGELLYVEDTKSEFSLGANSANNSKTVFFNEHSTKLCEIVNEQSKSINYEYDFGDSWIHAVQLEKIVAPSALKESQCVVAGKRCAPPEDSRGWIHEAEMLAGFDLSKPSEQAKSYLEGWGNDIDLVQELVDQSKEFLEVPFKVTDISISDPSQRYQQSRIY
jgi:hypothetical protein